MLGFNPGICVSEATCYPLSLIPSPWRALETLFKISFLSLVIFLALKIIPTVIDVASLGFIFSQVVKRWGLECVLCRVPHSNGFEGYSGRFSVHGQCLVTIRHKDASRLTERWAPSPWSHPDVCQSITCHLSMALDILYLWNHTECGLSHMRSFIQHNVPKCHLCYSIYQHFIFYGWIVFHCIHSVYLLVSQELLPLTPFYVRD